MLTKAGLEKIQIVALKKLVLINEIRHKRYQLSSTLVRDEDLINTFHHLADQSLNNLKSLKAWIGSLLIPEQGSKSAFDTGNLIPVFQKKDRLEIIKLILGWENEVIGFYNEALILDELHWSSAALVIDIGHQREGIQLARLKLKYLSR